MKNKIAILFLFIATSLEAQGFLINPYIFTPPSSLNVSLLSAYNFDGNANDYTAYANGTLTNGAAANGTPKVGTNSLNLDGINDYVSIAQNSFDVLTGDWTIAFWFNNTNPAGGTIFSNEIVSPSVNGIRITYQSGGTMSFQIWNASVFLANNVSVGTSGWTHVLCAHISATNYKMYVNGILTATSTNSLNPAFAATNYPTIGIREYALGSFDDPCSFLIDAVQIWTKALSQTEVTNLYNTGNGKQPPF